jgi:hypothetical protein
MMGKIVEFASHAMAQGPRRAARIGSQPCEIVIFPGIRYERWDSQAVQPRQPDPAPVRGKKRRSRKA